MGTGSSSKSTDTDVRNRLNSGDFQKVSPPSSPSLDTTPSLDIDSYLSHIETMTKADTTKDEMSSSGILVEKPGDESASPVTAAVTSPTATSAAMSASFAADLTTPPMSNRSKSRTKASSHSTSNAKDQPRRIIKATPPSKAAVGSDNGNDNDSESPAVHQPSTLASPIGANAASEMLEESIEKNDSKGKRLERVNNKQKSDRDKLLQEKRRRQTPGSDQKPKVQANPFSRFLSAFSVDAKSKNKRKESNADADSGDPNKRLKYGFNDSGGSSDNPEPGHAGSGVNDSDEEDAGTSPSSFSTWIAAASVATIAVLVFAIVRGSKKK